MLRQWLEEVDSRNASEAIGSRHPFFLFVNLMDVHGPYLPLRNAARKFAVGPIPEKSLAVPECGWRALTERDKAPLPERAAHQQEIEAVSKRLVDLYDDCLLGMDAELGRFLSSLEESGMLADTWVVITADHGEHFGDHNQFGHGSSLYNEMTHVPLVLIPPLGSGQPGRDPAVALRGLRINRAGLPARPRPARWPGFSARAATTLSRARASHATGMAIHRRAPDPVLSQLEDPRLRGESFRTENVIKVDSLIDEDHVLIESINQPPQLFELYRDPRQERNLADQPEQRSRLERMRATLVQMLRGDGSRPVSPQL